MADEYGEDESRHALDAVQVVQSMIDVSADRLEGLRTQCATSAELTQQEIRTLEGKLIKLFSRQLVTKAKLKGTDLPLEFENIPCLTQWLRVVGLSPESIEMVVRSVTTLEALQERADRELRAMLTTAPAHDVRRLTRAMHNLKKYMETLSQSGSSEGEIPLYWDSWERRASPRAPRTNKSRNTNHDAPPPPPSSPHSNRGKSNKFPTTPPPRRHIAGLAPPSTAPSPESSLFMLTTPGSVGSCHSALAKSKSHESQLSVNMTNDEDHSEKGSRSGLSGDCDAPPSWAAGLQSPPPSSGAAASHTQPSVSTVPVNDEGSLKSGNSVPRSPRTPTVGRGMGHYIAHRFTKTFKMIATCDYCDKQMLFGAGLKCKECKYKCHRDCEGKVPPSCGLPPEFVDEFRRKLQSDGSALAVNRSPSSGQSPKHAGGASGLLSSLAHRGRKRSQPQHDANAPLCPVGDFDGDCLPIC